MRVIVAGLYKTGTKTLKEALSILGYDVWDIAEQLNSVVGGPLAWEHLLQTDEEPVEQLKKMLEYCDAVTDGPSALLAVEVAQAFPESKVVLCVRDDEDVWYKSYEKNRDTLYFNVILHFLRLLSPTVRKRFDIMRLINDSLSSGRFGKGPHYLTYGLSPLLCKHAYRAHNAYVTQSTPPDRLLRFNVKQGWDPLCAFLEKNIPDQAFPHANRSSYSASLAGILQHIRWNSVKETRTKVILETVFGLLAIGFTLLAVTIAFHL